MIRQLNRPMAAALATAALAAAGCATATSAQTPPDKVDPILRTGPGGAEVIVLTHAQTTRIGVRTAPAADAATRAGRETSVPFSALLYDEQGRNWIFVRTPFGAYQREQVTVDRVVGDSVLLRSGPAAGTPVVTVGAAELLGAQLGVGGE